MRFILTYMLRCDLENRKEEGEMEIKAEVLDGTDLGAGFED